MADPRVARSGATLTLDRGRRDAGLEILYLEAIRQALFEEMERDERVFVLGEDVGVYGGAFKVTEGLLERFGAGRVVDTPIAEEAIVGGAIGAAMRGLRPVAEMQFIDFISRAFDLLTNFAAKNRYRTGVGVPLVVRGPAGAGVHGGPFHSQSPEMYFVQTPGLKVVAPATAYDAKGLLKAAIRDDDPVIYLEHKFLYRRVRDRIPAEDYVVPLGKAAVRRRGPDLTIVTYGAMLWTALEAADALAQGRHRGRGPRPPDAPAAGRGRDPRLRRRTAKCLVLHEDTRTGGIGAEIAATISEKAFEYLDGPILRVTAPDTPVPYSPPLEEAFLPNVEHRARPPAKARGLLSPTGDRRPMPTNVIMPQMGESIAEGTLTKWLKKRWRLGQAGRASLRDLHRQGGRRDPRPRLRQLLEILVHEGQTVPINTVVAHLGEAGESAAARLLPAPAPAPRSRRRPPPAASPVHVAAPAESPPRRPHLRRRPSAPCPPPPHRSPVRRGKSCRSAALRRSCGPSRRRRESTSRRSQAPESQGA